MNASELNANNEKYRNQVIDVKGVVREVTTNEFQIGVALLVQNHGDRIPLVECEIVGVFSGGKEFGSQSDFERLERGQEVVIRGTCRRQGEYGVLLQNCKVRKIKPGQAPPTTELDGFWVRVSSMFNGKKNDNPSNWTIRGNEIVIEREVERAFGASAIRETERYEGPFEIDASLVQKQITLEAEGPSGLSLHVYGIYELEGDTLKVCYSIFRDKRPDRFESLPDSGVGISVFRRAKRKTKP